MHGLSRPDPDGDRARRPAAPRPCASSTRCSGRVRGRWCAAASGSSRTWSAPSPGGVLAAADSRTVSERARVRGAGQLGTLGAGNHFVELQRVRDLYDAPAARGFGLALDQLTVRIHIGARGLGHQVCSDYVRCMDAALARYGIALPDGRLAVRPDRLRRGRASTWRRSRRPPTSPGPTATRSPIACAAASPRCSGRASPPARGRPTTSPTTSPSSSTTVAGSSACAAGRHAGISCGLAGDPRRRPRDRSADLHSRLDGHQQLRARPARRHDHVVRLDLPRHRPAHEPHAHAPPDHRSPAPAAAGPTASSCAARAPPPRRESPVRHEDVDRVARVVEHAALARRVARLEPIGVIKG